MGRAAFILAVVAVVAPSAASAADDTAPPAADAPPAAEPALSVEAPSVVVEPPVTETPPVRPPAPVTPVAPAATTAPPVAAKATAPPGPRPTRETHGLALAAGFGITYGGLGLQARYDLPIRPRFIVSPFVSAGVMFGPLSGPIGVSTTLGARHRLAVDLGVAPLEHSQFFLHGTLVTSRLVYGPMVAVGYEHMSDRGWFQRTTIEYAYEAWGVVPASSYRHIVFSGLAVGRRIW